VGQWKHGFCLCRLSHGLEDRCSRMLFWTCFSSCVYCSVCVRLIDWTPSGLFPAGSEFTVGLACWVLCDMLVCPPSCLSSSVITNRHVLWQQVCGASINKLIRWRGIERWEMGSKNIYREKNKTVIHVQTVHYMHVSWFSPKATYQWRIKIIFNKTCPDCVTLLNHNTVSLTL